VGDYIVQSHWMAVNKVKASVPAFVHALVYSLVFLALRPSLLAWLAIFSTHFVIDRWRLARYVVIIKNWVLAPSSFRDEWLDSNPLITATGFPEGTPVWLATWLLIIVDNTLHLLCNGAALRWL